MSKSIKEMTSIITKFCDERGWSNEKPSQLACSTFIELAELAEHYQWKSEFENWDEQKKKEVGFEFVDVIWYLLRIAAKSDIDIEKYFDMKLPLLAEKFKPGEDHIKKHDEYRNSGKNKLYDSE